MWDALPACSQNKGLSEYQRRASRLRTDPSPTGGKRQGEGKVATSAPERASPTKLQTGFKSLTKDFLRFWMVDIHQKGCSQRSAPQNRQKAHPTCTWKLRLGTRRGRATPHPERVCSSSSWLPELLRPGKAQNSGPNKSAHLWSTRELEPQATHGPLPIEKPGASTL